MDRGPRRRHQLLRHRQRVRRRSRPDRVDHRPLVRAGRPAAREARARHQGLRRTRRLAEHGPAVGAAHPPGLRRQPAPAADRPHRPLPDAPRRPRHAVGRDLAGDGPARAAGQGALRRQQQLRRAGTSSRRTRPPRRRGSLGLVSEQSLYNLNARTVELEVLPACEHYGVGVIPWSPLGGGLLGGALADRAAGGRRGNRADPGLGSSTPPAARGSGRSCAPSSARSRPTSRSRGCSTTPS